MMVGKATQDMIAEMAKHILDNHKIDVMDTTRRFRPVVISRAALFNACRGLMTSTQLARQFDMNHATVLHHYNMHKGHLMMDYYRHLYFSLMKIRTEYDEVAKQYYDDVTVRLADLQKDYEVLTYKYERLKEKYEEANS